MKYIITILIASSSLGLLAQNSTLDSLRSLMDSENAAQHNEIYIELANEWAGLNIDSAIYFYQKALDLAYEREDDSLFMRGLNRLGNILTRKGDYQNGEIIFNKYLKIAAEFDQVTLARGSLILAFYQFDLNKLGESINTTNKALRIFNQLNLRHQSSMCLSLLGNNYQRLSDYEKALSYYFSSLAIKEELQDKRGISIMYSSIGNIYLLTNKNDDAEKYFRECLKIDRELEDEEGIMVSLLNLGVVLERKNDHEAAIDYYQNALDYAQRLSFEWDEAILLGNIGSSLKSKGEFEASLEYLFKSLSIKESLRDPGSTAHTCNEIAETYLALANYEKAREYAQKSIDLAKGTDLNRLSTALDYLAQIDSKTGNYNSAYQNLVKAEAIKDSIFSIESDTRINELELKYETEKKEEQIASLTQQQEAEKFKRNTYILIALFLLLFLSLLYYQQRVKTRRNRLLYEKEQEIEQMKSRFFANISHEFRTPLTLILGPLTSMIEETEDAELSGKFKLMHRNASRLLQLINQLLDLSKLESGSLNLKLENVDMVTLIRGVVMSFHSLTEQKKIKLNLSIQPDSLEMQIDTAMIESVLTNLLSNAFKFTPEDGSIEVNIDTQLNGPRPLVYIEITDSGQGIPKEDLEHIFDRFYQSSNNQLMQHEGSGIGLALTKELVELHEGTITVESEVGEGTRFMIKLPTDLEGEGQSAEHETNFSNLAPSAIIIDDEVLPEEEIANNQEQPMLLVVEDHVEVYNYIFEILKDDYQIIYAKDGEEGIDKAMDQIPDLIISDVMMPHKNGYEVCATLKQEEKTSHIPIILLTAKASIENKIEGLDIEADDYITKPFIPKELQLRVRNIISSRKKLREKYSKEGVLRPSEISVNSLDQQFLEKIMTTVESHIGDEQFGVEQLSEQIGMSRSQLHRKLKALIDQGPNQFIRSFRLTRAHNLLEQKAATASEISYQVGFSSPSYFSKCFQDQFGYSPSSLIKEDL